MIARLRSPVALAVGPVLIIAIAFYVWTAATSASLAPGPQTDPYNSLLDGFQKGHLYLDKTPDPRLAALGDPYDPRLNAPFVTPDIRDVVLYERRFYIYWGAAPGIVVMWPFRLLGLGDLPQTDAVLVLTVLGLLSSVALLLLLTRRWLQRTRPWMLGAGTAALAFGNMAPWLLRRPESYEVAIAGGMGFGWASLFALVLALRREHPPAWLLGVSSLLAGLAFSSRPPIGIVFLVLAAAGVWLWRGGRLHRGQLAALAGPALICTVLVGLYNQARFGTPGNFGTSFVLSGEKADRFSSLTYVAPGLWYYLFCPWQLRVEFPFAWVAIPHVPFPTPRLYTAAERTVGLLPSTPILFALLAAPWALRGSTRGLRRTVAALVGAGALLLLFTAYFYWGAIQRYEADFAAPLILAALLVWFAAAERLRGHRRARRALASGATALVSIGIVLALAFSMIGSDNRLLLRHPATYRALADTFAPVGTAIASIAGHPVLASVGDNALLGPQGLDRLGVGPVDVFLGNAPYPVAIVSGGEGRATLVARPVKTPGAPPGHYVVSTRSPDGSVFSAVVRGRVVRLPVSLQGGRNVIQLQMFADPPGGIPAYINGFDDPGVVLEGLRLTH